MYAIEFKIKFGRITICFNFAIIEGHEIRENNFCEIFHKIIGNVHKFSGNTVIRVTLEVGNRTIFRCKQDVKAIPLLKTAPSLRLGSLVNIGFALEMKVADNESTPFLPQLYHHLKYE